MHMKFLKTINNIKKNKQLIANTIQGLFPMMSGTSKLLIIRCRYQDSSLRIPTNLSIPNWRIPKRNGYQFPHQNVPIFFSSSNVGNFHRYQRCNLALERPIHLAQQKQTLFVATETVVKESSHRGWRFKKCTNAWLLQLVLTFHRGQCS